jgi:hypothetical protein
MKKITEKSIGVRISPELYDKVIDLCEKLGGIPVNNFAQNSMEIAVELLTQKEPQIPKWIAVGRYSLDFQKGEKI